MHIINLSFSTAEVPKNDLNSSVGNTIINKKTSALETVCSFSTNPGSTENHDSFKDQTSSKNITINIHPFTKTNFERAQCS